MPLPPSLSALVGLRAVEAYLDHTCDSYSMLLARYASLPKDLMTGGVRGEIQWLRALTGFLRGELKNVRSIIHATARAHQAGSKNKGRNSVTSRRARKRDRGVTRRQSGGNPPKT